MLHVSKKEVRLMSDAQEKTSKTYDPFEPFRSMRDTYLDAMAKAMVETVNTEAYAQATGTMLEGYLTAIAPFREALDKSMLQTLQQMELPSRQEVAALAERFTNLEMRLDDMDAKLDAIRKHVEQNGSTPQSGAGKAAAATPAARTGEGGNHETPVSRPGARQPFVRRKLSRTRR